MIPQDIRPGATPQALDGATQKFSIEANGIAFRSLIDGLYSNKVLAVIRELCSNAHDSHIEAGQTIPFTVQIPTSLDPVFSVRDYGVGLSHEDVFGLYTTIFQSSKRETNELTGQLGLGSKSPFAYTDSFSVKAYSGPQLHDGIVSSGERRTYLAHLATDGVPALTFVNTTPSDEPRGLEVSFAAKRDDINSFQREMQFVAMAYTMKMIDIQGMRIKMMDARAKGSNWAIYPAGAFGDSLPSKHYIRQGSALYPSTMQFPNVGWGFISITEIPIGTAAVTSSRDALSYDGATRTAIEKVHNAAYLELKAQIDAVVLAAKTRVERAKVYAEYNGLLTNMRGTTMVSLWNDPDAYNNTTPRPGDTLEMAKHFGKSQNTRGVYNRHASQFDYMSLDKLRFLVNDAETKLVRRTKRIRNASLGRGNFVYVIDLPVTVITTDKVTKKRTTSHPRKEAIAWIKECLEVTDDKFVVVSTLPDDPPVRSNNPAKPKVRRALTPGQFWMIRHNGQVESNYGISDRGVQVWPVSMRQAAKVANVDLNWADVFWVTPLQKDRLDKRSKKELPDNRRLDNHIAAILLMAANKAPLDAAQTWAIVREAVGRWNEALPVVMANFFPGVKITPDQATAAINLAEMANIDLQNRPIAASINLKIKELIEQYPLLFQRSDRKHYEHYVTAVRASKKEEVAP